MGGDLQLVVSAITSTRFNPRPRMGGDFVTGSIKHASVRFNPRPRMGGDKGFGIWCNR